MPPVYGPADHQVELPELHPRTAMVSDKGHRQPGNHPWLTDTTLSAQTEASSVPGSPDSRHGPDATQTAPAGPAALTQTRYEHYEIQRREDGTLWILGAGAMGATYKAFDTRLHCIVALKVIHSTLLEKHPVLRERFLREARAAASVRHPNIANVFHLGEHSDGQCFYAMEFVDGETVAERVRRRGPLPPLQALEVAAQVTHALVVSGQADLIHRDIKPSNVMLTTNGLSDSVAGLTISGGGSDGGTALLVKVIDFGLVRTIKPDAGHSLTAAGDFVGTPHYASPEQLAGDDERIDIRSDIYSLGSTLWFMLTGQQPFAGASFEEIEKLQRRALPVAQLREAGVPPPLIALLKLMLEANPNRRPQTPVMLAESLNECRVELLETVRASGGGGSTIGRAGPGYAGGVEPTWRTWLTLAIAALTLCVLIAACWLAWTNRRAPLPVPAAVPEAVAPGPAIPEKSIAVLPFENLSTDRDNAFFADGIQDDVLTSLVKIRELRVISRSSVLPFRDPAARANLREIGRSLGVVHVLEGSVRRSGNRVRVDAQLIDTRNGAQLWAEAYDRELSDALTIQSELAREIAGALRARLSPEEQARVGLKPTRNPDAYILYLRAREQSLQADIILDELQAVERLYEQAIALDPSFALAYARLSVARSRIAINYEPSTARFAGVRAAAEKALSLQPDLGEAHLALGLYFYGGEHNYDRALQEYAFASHALPNDAEVLRAIGYVQRRQGHWAEARASFERAVVLGPRDSTALDALARFYLNAREWPAASQAYDRAVDLVPTSVNSRMLRAYIAFHWKGDLVPMRDTFRALAPGMTDPEGMFIFGRYDTALLDGNYAEAERVLAGSSLDAYPMSISTPFHRRFLQGMIYLARRAPDDAVRARECFEAARSFYEESARNYPLAPLRHVDLGVLYAALGWRAAAVAEGQKALQLLQQKPDVLVTSTVTLRLARLYAVLGDADNTFPLLEQLCTMPVDEWNGFSQFDLRLRPEWATLRKDPRYPRLLDKLSSSQVVSNLPPP